MSGAGGDGLLDEAFERTSWGLALVSQDGTITRINTAAAALAGEAPAALVGQNFGALIHIDDLALATSGLVEALEVGQVGPLEVRVRQPDGSYEWVSCSGTMVPGDPPMLFFVASYADHLHHVAHRPPTARTELAQHELARRSSALSDIARLVTTHDDVDTLILGVAGLALRHLAATVGVVLLDEAGERVHLAHIAHRDSEAEALLRELLGDLQHGWAVEGALAEVLHDVNRRVNLRGPIHPELPTLLREYGKRYPPGPRCLIPMRTRQGALGALLLIREEGADDFSPADVHLAEVLASRAAAAVNNARLDERRRRAEEETARRAAQQAAIAELGTLALSGASVEHVADHCRKQIEAILDVQHAGVLIDDAPADALLVVAASASDWMQLGEARHDIDPRVLETLEAEGYLLVHDVHEEERFTWGERLLRTGVRSLAAAPIEPRTGRVGILCVASEQAGDFTHDDARFLEALANVLANAIDSKRSFEDLHHNAMHDALTGLPNRVLLLDRLGFALEQAVARGTHVAVLVCDVDRFKVVNDGLGHEAGDEVLRSVALRLRAHVRPGDTVGRFGGDEFVVVCPDVVDLEDVVAIAERLGAAFSEPMRVLGTELVATASIGIAMGSSESATAATDLLRDADAAMYRAKARGRGGYEIYDEEMRERAAARLRTEADLRRALDAEELVLHYQPVVAADGSRVVGLEALVRWAHPTRGLLAPAEFVRVAEESGLMLELGAWALEEAARQATRWTAGADEDPPGWVAVNLGARQLVDPRLIDRIDAALEASGLDAARLRIEITEDAIVEDAEQTTEVLDSLRRRGIRISVDDFGTGYSSLAYLKRLPVELLKLDGAFVAGLGEGGDDVVIASAMIVMAQALGMQVVAEGVETAAQLEVLRALGCDHVQGYLFAPPMPRAALEAWLDAGLPALG